MEVLGRFEPRNPALARTVLFVLTWAAAGVTLVFTVAFPTLDTGGHGLVATVGCLAVLAVGSLFKVLSRPPRWLWAGYPLAAVALIAVLDVVTRDASATAQIFFFFPVLYAGAQLRRQATTVICATAIAGEALVNVWLLPASSAILNVGFVGAALAAAAGLLVHAGEQTDDLITRLQRLAAVDPLTGLLTRRVLDNAAQSAVGGAENDGGTALLLMDVDHFKPINDVHGHLAGDTVLQELATLLMGLHRRGDIMSRIGGDEIALLLPGCSLPAALTRAEEILLEVRAHTFDVSAHSLSADVELSASLPVSLSIGVAHLPTHARDLRALFAAADAALYQAKRGGRDRVAASHADTLI